MLHCSPYHITESMLYFQILVVPFHSPNVSTLEVKRRMTHQPRRITTEAEALDLYRHVVKRRYGG